MRSSEEVKRFLEALMGWGLEMPWHYGGSPQGADTVFWHWRQIWAVLTERQHDFSDAMTAATPRHPLDDEQEPVPAPRPSIELTVDPAAYAIVVSFWKEVDKRLGIDYPPDTNISRWADPPRATD
jgi:hypothetical protein